MFHSFMQPTLIWKIYSYDVILLYNTNRGKEMLQYDDNQMADFRGYDLVHHDDLAYVASAHAECKLYLTL